MCTEGLFKTTNSNSVIGELKKSKCTETLHQSKFKCETLDKTATSKKWVKKSFSRKIVNFSKTVCSKGKLKVRKFNFQNILFRDAVDCSKGK
jgi:hypothetical protein